MKRQALIASLLLSLAASGVAAPELLAKPPFARKGHPGGAGGGGGSAQVCDGGSSVCAQFENGQVFVTWDDLATGATGNNYRYSLYRSTSPITSGNYGSATLIASEILNNSGQLFGGTVNQTGAAFNQTNRQSNTMPMAKISDLAGGTTTLAYGKGLQVYTATGTQNAYYAIVATTCPSSGCPNGAAGGTDTYIGSAGPIAESVATPKPVLYSHTTSGYGAITAASGKQLNLYLHQSSSGGGCPSYCGVGDYWQWWLTPTEGWQDGRATTLNVLQDNSAHYIGTASSIEVTTRDTVWNPLGSAGMETQHQGQGLTPNPLVGVANRWYPTTINALTKMLAHVVSYYGVDSNQVHCTGVSMGAWGCANVTPRITSPRFSTAWLGIPVWRPDHQSSGYWPGQNWASNMPFKATLETAPSTLGSTASSILTYNGATWGGNGGYADTFSLFSASPGDDMPVMLYLATKNDPFASWADQITARDTLQSAHRGHAFSWAMGAHETTSPAFGLLSCDVSSRDTSVCYGKALFKLNAPYLATSNSSIDDNPGTATTTANGLYDGDYSGCVNCGFTWNFTTDNAGTLAFTVDNTWMDKTPTANPQTTLTGSIASSGTGSVTVTDGSVFQSTSTYPYFLVGGTEVIQVTGVSGNTVTYTTRGLFGSSSQSHASSQTIMQFVSKNTGPNGGPYSSMTADITPRRLQGFLKSAGTTITCTVTPNGESPVTKTGTVVGSNGVFTITGIKINASGATSVSCS